MNIYYNFLAAFTLFYVQHIYALDSTEQPVSRKSFSASDVSCPAADFLVFIRAFSNDINVQKAFTKYPLKLRTVTDPAHSPKPEYLTRVVRKKQIHFPVLLNEIELKTYGLVTNVERVSQKSFSVIESSAGDRSLGHYVEYKFKLKSGCWLLEEIVDEST